MGPTLQSLKKLLEKVPEDVAERLKYEKVVHGLLSASLVNIDAMRFVCIWTAFVFLAYAVLFRGRDGAACRKKIKNNMLAAVLILTILPPTIRLSKAVIEHCCFLISQQISEPNEVCRCRSH